MSSSNSNEGSGFAQTTPELLNENELARERELVTHRRLDDEALLLQVAKVRVRHRPADVELVFEHVDVGDALADMPEQVELVNIL